MRLQTVSRKQKNKPGKQFGHKKVVYRDICYFFYEKNLRLFGPSYPHFTDQL